MKSNYIEIKLDAPNLIANACDPHGFHSGNLTYLFELLLEKYEELENWFNGKKCVANNEFDYYDLTPEQYKEFLKKFKRRVFKLRLYI